MRNRILSVTALGCAIAVGLFATAPTAAQGPEAALQLASARVSIAGTSNIHPYTASTTNVRLTKFALAPSAVLADVLKPGTVTAFEVAVRAAALTSPKEGLDKNMHKALKTAEYPDVMFRLLRLEGAPDGALRAIGLLKIAGVEKEVAMAIKAASTPAAITVTGELTLLMTDYGITPPKAMLGMLKTDPKITVTFETVLALPLT